MSARTYKVEVVTEGALGTLFLGASKLPTKKMEETMNRYGQNGWDLHFQMIEQKRFLLFWKREAAILTFSKKIAVASDQRQAKRRNLATAQAT